MKIIRLLLGNLILFVSWLASPPRGKREAVRQQQVEKALADYALYQFPACPFCVKVRRELRRLNLPMDIRNVQKPGRFRDELMREGGKVQVPCLRITQADGEVQWLYESGDIVTYLREHFSLR